MSLYPFFICVLFKKNCAKKNICFLFQQKKFKLNHLKMGGNNHYILTSISGLAL
jgi:hypothetical protein